jgi:hypothetical protein
LAGFWRGEVMIIAIVILSLAVLFFVVLFLFERARRGDLKIAVHYAIEEIISGEPECGATILEAALKEY